jgi:hypothetical protein
VMRLRARSQRTGDIGDLIFVSGVERAQRGWLVALLAQRIVHTASKQRASEMAGTIRQFVRETDLGPDTL